MKHEIYIATVLLEANRWKREKIPTVKVSDWLERFEKAGFDGIELWENHAALADELELGRLRGARPPVRIFNTYASFSDEPDPRRERAVELSRSLGVRGVKFNVGRDPECMNRYIDNVLRWREGLPRDIVPLCECHPGTVLEEPGKAAEAFRVWAEAGIEAIIHAFNLAEERLRAWFRQLGGAITHVHVQVNRQGRMASLVQYRDEARETVRLLRDEGFQGSFSIEFTAGVGMPDENVEALFAAAVADLDLLRELLEQ